MHIISYILIFQILLGALMPFNDFSQWSKLVNLIDHYQEHKENTTHNQLSFLEYINCHFGSIEHNHSDSHNSNQHNLPLQHIDAPIFSFFHDPNGLPGLGTEQYTGKIKINYAENALPEGMTGSVFHPPSRG